MINNPFYYVPDSPVPVIPIDYGQFRESDWQCERCPYRDICSESDFPSIEVGNEREKDW